MALAVALLYLLAVVLVGLAAFGVSAKADLALLGLAVALLAYALPVIDAGLVG